MSPTIRFSRTIFYSLSYLNSRLGLNRLEYLYSVISVIVDQLPANTKIMAIDMFVDGQSEISRILCGIEIIHQTKFRNPRKPDGF